MAMEQQVWNHRVPSAGAPPYRHRCSRSCAVPMRCRCGALSDRHRCSRSRAVPMRCRWRCSFASAPVLPVACGAYAVPVAVLFRIGTGAPDRVRCRCGVYGGALSDRHRCSRSRAVPMRCRCGALSDRRRCSRSRAVPMRCRWRCCFESAPVLPITCGVDAVPMAVLFRIGTGGSITCDADAVPMAVLFRIGTGAPGRGRCRCGALSDRHRCSRSRAVPMRCRWRCCFGSAPAARSCAVSMAVLLRIGAGGPETRDAPTLTGTRGI